MTVLPIFLRYRVGNTSVWNGASLSPQIFFLITPFLFNTYVGRGRVFGLAGIRQRIISSS